MKEIVIFDVDGTIIKGQSQEYFLKYLLQEGKISLLFYFKIYAWFILYRLHLVSNPLKPMEYAFSFLKGRSVVEINSWCKVFFEGWLKNFIYNDVHKIIHEHNKAGRRILLVSNSIRPIIAELAAYLHVSDYIATELGAEGGIYTGDIIKTVYGQKAKLVQNFLRTLDVQANITWAYSDHVSDRDLLQFVDFPFAINPTGEFRSLALNKHWQILCVTK